MMKLSIQPFALALILLVGSSEASLASKKNAFVPKKHEFQRKNPLLEIRGGAGPIDPLTLAKVATVLEGAQGLVGHVAPSFMTDQYKIGDSSPTTDYLQQLFATGLFSISIMSYCLLFKDTSFATAYQFALIPWIMNTIGDVLNKKPSAAGFDDSKQVFNLLVNMFMMYAANQDWADTAFKVTSVWWLLNGLYMVIDPTGAAKLWGNDSLQGIAVMVMRFFGFYLIAASIMTAAIVVGNKDALTAFGYVEVVWVMFHLVTHHFTGEVKKYNVPELPMNLWLLFHAVVAAAILL